MKDGSSILTIAEPVETVFREKRSAFHSYLFRCDSHRQAIEKLKEMGKSHANATHVCWAYRIAEKGFQEASSDAGEPRGTAGIQILNVLRTYELANVLCVVVRYFGGVKLGIPGLIQAYRRAAESAVLRAKIVKAEKFFRYHITCDYDEMSKIMEKLRREGFKVAKIEQAEKVEIQFLSKSFPVEDFNGVIFLNEEWGIL